MLRAIADHAVDLSALRHGGGERHRRRLGVVERDAVDETGDRLPDRRPVGLGLVAGLGEGRAQPRQHPLVAQLGQAGAAEQDPQRGIAEGGPVEFGEMRIAAGRIRQYGIADVVKRGAVLPRRQRPAGGAGKIMKAHEIPGRGGLGRGHQARCHLRATPCKSLKKLPGFAGKTNVMEVTEKPARRLHDRSPEGYGEAVKAAIWIGELSSIFRRLVQILSNLLPQGLYPVKGLFGAAPQIARNSGSHPRPIPQT